jgi:aspartate aminotransferase
MDKLQSQLTSCASRIAQVAAVAALTGPRDSVDRMRLAFDQRRRDMHARLVAIPDVRCIEPRGAFYCFPDISAYLGRTAPDGEVMANDVSLCDYLVRAGRVAVVPGTGFGTPGYVRLSYACGLDDIRTGVTRMAEALARLG